MWANVGRLRFSASGALLATCVLGTWLLVAPLAYWQSGQMGIVASAIAAGLCLLSAEAALAIVEFQWAGRGAWQAALLAMLLRAGLPLVLGGAIHLLSPTMAGAGLLLYLLGFYLLTLLVETTLVVSRIQQASHSSKAP